MIARGLEALRSEPLCQGRMETVLERSAVPPRYRVPTVDLADPLHDLVASVERPLFDHQADAIELWHAGWDLVLATPTSSGKSLAINVCVADTLLAEPQGTALYLYPTKALAQDQLPGLADLDQRLGLRAHPAVYDGDTPSSARARIRDGARIVASNPWGMHEYLPQVAGWRRFLGSLRVVVIDEAHRYRGVLGANVAMVLRRLERLAGRFGARPRYILASGTLANPGELAEALVGRPVTVVGPEQDGAGHGALTVVVVDAGRAPTAAVAEVAGASSAAAPPAGVVTRPSGSDVALPPGGGATGSNGWGAGGRSGPDPTWAAGPGPMARAEAAVAALARAGLRVVCFAGSRAMVEVLARRIAERAPGVEVSPYRAGLQAHERREIEVRLRRGEIDVVVATSALELGVDIGGLDVAVVVGYPGTVASLWQQIGRVGRRGRSGLAVLVLGDDPIDAHLVRRPMTVLGAPVERGVLATGNPSVTTGHVLCAAAEAPVTDEDARWFGPTLSDVRRSLRAEGLLAPLRMGDGFVGTFRPASVVRLDGRDDDAVELCVEGRTLEVLERWRALVAAHPGAVLLHRGMAVRVTTLDLDQGVALAEPCDPAEHTRPIVERRWRIDGAARRWRRSGWAVAVGPVQVVTQVTGYRRYRHGRFIGAHALALPTTVLDTRGLSLCPEGGVDALEVLVRLTGTTGAAGTAGAAGASGVAGTSGDRPREGHVLAGASGVAGASGDRPQEGHVLAGLHAAEHALIHALALLAVADRHDAGGLSTTADPIDGWPRIVVHDGIEGGSGVVDAVAGRIHSLAQAAAEMVAGCDCTNGCPRCVFDRSCGSGNADLDRIAGLAVLRSLAAS